MVDFSSTYGRIFKLLVLFKMKGTGSFSIAMGPIPEGIQSQTGQTLVINELTNFLIEWSFTSLSNLRFLNSQPLIFVDEKTRIIQVKCFVQSHTSHLRQRLVCPCFPFCTPETNTTLLINYTPIWSYFHLLFILVFSSSLQYRKWVHTIFW